MCCGKNIIFAVSLNFSINFFPHVLLYIGVIKMQTASSNYLVPIFTFLMNLIDALCTEV